MSVTVTKPAESNGQNPNQVTTRADPGRQPARRVRDRIRATVIWVRLGMARHRLLVASITGLLWTIVALLRMLWPTPVGLGDAGDGQRLLCQAGLTPSTPAMGSSAGYVDLEWEPHRFYGETCGVPATGENYYSSHLIMLRVAVWISSVIGLSPGIDLRVLAVLCSVLVGVGVTLLVLALPPALSLPKRVLVASVAGLIMVDSGVARFYASPYSEPSALLGVLLLLPAVLWLLRQRRFTWGPLLAVAATGAFAILSKTQMVSVLPVLVIILLLRPSLPPKWNAGIAAHRKRQSTTIRRSRTTHWLWLRVPGLALVVLVAAVASTNVTNQPDRYSEINAYSQIFTTLLPMSPDPERDLRWFGLDPALARGAGTHIYSPDTVAYEPAYEGFTDAVSEGKVAMFYLSQPGRFVKLFDAGLKGMAGYDTEKYMANYTEESGKPPFAKESRVSVIYWLAGSYRAVPWLFVLHWLVAAAVFWMVARRWRGVPRRQSLGILGLSLLGAATAQFWAVMMSEGNNEIFKHMVVVDLMMFLTVPLLLAIWLARRRDDVHVDREPVRT